MDVWRLLGAAARRWYVFVALLALAAAAATTAGSRVAPEYTSSTSVLLVSPSVEDVSNPYADLDTAAQSLAIVLQSGATRGAVVEAGLSEDYEVTGVPRTPILQVTVRAPSLDVAVATAEAVISAANDELTSRQEGAAVPGPNLVTIDVLSAPSGAVETGRGQLQAQVAVLGLGGVLAFFAAVFFDDVLLLLRQRRQRQRAPAPSPVVRPAAASQATPTTLTIADSSGSSGVTVQRRVGSARLVTRRVPAGKSGP